MVSYRLLSFHTGTSQPHNFIAAMASDLNFDGTGNLYRCYLAKPDRRQPCGILGGCSLLGSGGAGLYRLEQFSDHPDQCRQFHNIPVPVPKRSIQRGRQLIGRRY